MSCGCEFLFIILASTPRSGAHRPPNAAVGKTKFRDFEAHGSQVGRNSHDSSTLGRSCAGEGNEGQASQRRLLRLPVCARVLWVEASCARARHSLWLTVRVCPRPARIHQCMHAPRRSAPHLTAPIHTHTHMCVCIDACTMGKNALSRCMHTSTHEHRRQVPGSVGVVVCGGSLPHYGPAVLGVDMEEARVQRPDEYFALEIGTDKDYLATQISFRLDLHGPSEVVQTACSSGLVAIVRAVQMLRLGLCDFVVCGGASFSPDEAVRKVDGMIWSEDPALGLSLSIFAIAAHTACARRVGLWEVAAPCLVARERGSSPSRHQGTSGWQA